jgi:hypothetical protein
VSAIPNSLTSYIVAQATLNETWAFLRERGERRLEAVVLWLGRLRDETTAEILAPVIPEQIAYITEQGVAVEITDDGLSALTAALPAGVFVFCRVHSHPREAFHSGTDDDNMLISHEGAISIVVPNFGAGPAELGRCAIFRLSHERGWQKLGRRELTRTFEVRDG